MKSRSPPIPHTPGGFRGSVVALECGQRSNVVEDLYNRQPSARRIQRRGSVAAAGYRSCSRCTVRWHGNNYDVPQSVRDCLAFADPASQSACFASDDYFDAALSLDLRTGAVHWAHRLQGFDVWTVACLTNTNPVACPVPSSPDFDLGGSGPNLLPGLVGFGQKSGIYWALNPSDGSILWSAVVGPGGVLGGIEWGTATDGERIYVAITNAGHLNYTLIDGTTVTSGAWSALDPKTGKDLVADADRGRNGYGRCKRRERRSLRTVLFRQYARAPKRSNGTVALDIRERRVGNRWTVHRRRSCLLGARAIAGSRRERVITRCSLSLCLTIEKLPTSG